MPEVHCIFLYEEKDHLESKVLEVLPSVWLIRRLEQYLTIVSYSGKGEKRLLGWPWDQVNELLVRWPNQQSGANIPQTYGLWRVS